MGAWDPDLIVELSTDPFGEASPSWTAISAHVRAVNITRGRNNQLERTVPGTCRLVLANRDRAFDPSHSSGPFYPDLRPMNRIRVSAEHNSVTYLLFYGYVSGWPQDYHASNNDATVEVLCTDLFGYLSNVELAAPWAYAVTALSPTNWYVLDDANTDVIRDAVAGDAGVYAPEGVSFTAPLIPSAVASVAITSPGYLFLGSSARATLDSGEFTLLFAVQRSGAPSSAQVLFSNDRGNPNVLDDEMGYVIELTTSGTVVVRQHSFLGGELESSTSVCDGRPHLVVLTVDGLDQELWVDGVSEDTRTASIPFQGATGKVIVGYGQANGFNGQLSARVGDIVIWDSVLADAEIEALAEVALGVDGDTAAERIARLLTQAGYVGVTDLEAGEPRCGEQTDGGTALSLLQLVDATEQGRFFIAADGTPTLHNRTHNITAARSSATQATFSDDVAALGSTGAADVPFHKHGPRLTQDIVQTINEVSVSSPSLPAAVTVKDGTAQASYGVQARPVSTVARSVRDAESVAQYLVVKYAQPQMRADAWQVAPQRKPVVWPTVLGLELGDRVVVERTPQGVGSQIQVPLYLERIEHQITPTEWICRFSGIPAEPEASTQYWQLGVSELGVDTTLYV